MNRPWTLAILLASCCTPVLAQSAPQVPPAAPAGAQRLLRTLVLEHIPPEYENTKRWGGTKRVWDGLHVSLDGLRLKTKRRWKEANHGTWKRYRAWLIDPEQEFQIEVQNMAAGADGKTTLDVVIDARLGVWGRLSEYALDVQLLSISAEAEAKVRMTVSCEVSLRLDVAKFPPDVILEPHVVGARLHLIDFDLVRISDANGPLVREFGEELHDVLQDEITHRQAKLVDKINRQLDKHEDDLRLSLSDLAASGLKQLRPSPVE